MLTTEERSRRIKEGLRRAKELGKPAGGTPKKIPEAEGLRICELCKSGQMMIQDGAKALGVCQKTFYNFCKEHGYLRKQTEYAKLVAPKKRRRTSGRKLKMPDERGLKALREYYARECTLRDVCEYCGVCYATAKRWTTQGLGKETE